MVGQTIEQRRYQRVAGEDLLPFREYEIHRDDRARSLRAFSDHFEKQLGFFLVEPRIAELVKKQQVVRRNADGRYGGTDRDGAAATGRIRAKADSEAMIVRNEKSLLKHKRFDMINYTHKRPLRGHCAPPLQKPGQSVCALRA